MTVAFQELIETLRQEGVADVEEHVAAFRRADTKRSAHSDPDRLLAYLYAANVIDEQQYRGIHGAEIARVTEISGLHRGEWAKGTVQRRYVPVGLIGSGSMGKVYVARERDLNRKVAFKQISANFQSDDHLMRRFVAEVQITAQLNHPNVVPVYGLEVTPEGSLGYAMKLVQGRTLEEIIGDAMERHDARQPINESRELKERLDYFVRVCDAVAYAHSRGVIHGDLKPANVMVGSFGKIYVMDWGLARLIASEDLDPEDSVDLTADGETDPLDEEGQAIGTPAYMSPEQARGLNSRLSHLDSKSDQYALGLILQELVTLWPAIDGETTDEVLKKAGSGFRNPFKHMRRGVRLPQELAAIVSKATQRHYDRRYPDVSTLAEDVRCYLRDEPVLARPEGIVRKLSRVMAKYREGVVILVLLTFLAAASTIIGSLLIVEATQYAAQQRQNRLGKVITTVSMRGHYLDTEARRYERLLETLGASAAHLLDYGAPNGELPIYLNTDFDSGSAPPDLASSPYYGMDVSLQAPVFKLAPGVTKKEVEPTLLRMVSLRNQLRRTLFRSRDDHLTVLDTATKRTLLAEGAPIVWVYVGLSEGVHLAFPGHGGYAAEFDPRKRPWYTLSEMKKGVHWGNPYVDASGKGLMLPCSTALYDGKGWFRGVVGIDLTIEHIVESMADPGLPGATYYLLDEEGRVVVDSNETVEHFGARVLDDRALETPLFFDADVVLKVQQQYSGHLYVNTEEGRRLVVLSRLDSLGWYYVVVGDTQELFKSQK